MNNISQLTDVEMQTLRNGGMVSIVGMTGSGPFTIQLVYKTPWDRKPTRALKRRPPKRRDGKSNAFDISCAEPKCPWVGKGYKSEEQAQHGLRMHKARVHGGMKAPHQK